MRKNLNVSTDALGKMLAEYLVIQGWAEENPDGTITLNQTGIEKLAGPPYFFYLRDEDSPDEVNQVEVASNAATFTWYQKNFSPGKFRQPNADRQQQIAPDLNNWKPGLISNSSDQPRQQSTFIPRQQYQHQGGQGYQGKKFYPKNQGNQQHAGGGGKKFYPKNQQQGQHFSKNSGGGSPIKLSHNVPQIAKPQHFKNNKFKK